MRIAVNTRFLLSHKMEGFGWYTYEVTKRLVEQHPEHDFIFFFDRKYDEKFIFGKNVTPVVLSPQARHPFLFYIWFEIAVKKALKKYKVDLFLSPDGYLSLSSSCKQIGVIHDINFEHNPKDLKWLMRKYYLAFFPKFAKKADHLLTVSEYSKNDICVTYGIDSKKITAIWNGASPLFKPVSESVKSESRKMYSEGKPYFLFVGSLHPRKNIKRLILAFEKYRIDNPTSEYRLVIVGTELWANSITDIEVSDSIKQQINFTGHLAIEELAKVMASASIFTFVPYFEGFGIPLVEAMKCGTPIISGNKTSLPEVAGAAALYCDPFSIDDIALKMAELSSNIELQQKLSIQGLERSQLFNWDKTAQEVWRIIESTVNK